MKVLKIIDETVLLGDPVSKKLMKVSLTDCFEGIKIGDSVELFNSEDMVFVVNASDNYDMTISNENTKENPSESIVLNVVGKNDSSLKEQEVIVSSEESKEILTESAFLNVNYKSDSNLSQNVVNVEPIVEEDIVNQVNQTHPDRKKKDKKRKRIVPLLTTVISAIVLSFFTGREVFIRIRSYMMPEIRYDYSRQIYNHFLSTYVGPYGEKPYKGTDFPNYTVYKVPRVLKQPNFNYEVVVFGHASALDWNERINNLVFFCYFETVELLSHCEVDFVRED